MMNNKIVIFSIRSQITKKKKKKVEIQIFHVGKSSKMKQQKPTVNHWTSIFIKLEREVPSVSSCVTGILYLLHGTAK